MNIVGISVLEDQKIANDLETIFQIELENSEIKSFAIKQPITTADLASAFRVFAIVLDPQKMQEEIDALKKLAGLK